MICREATPEVPDLAGPLRTAAKKEVKRKGITSDLYSLTHCSNPYAISNGIVVISNGIDLDVYEYGNLMFRTVHGQLQKYICGDWSDIIAKEVKSIRSQRLAVNIQDRVQRAMNGAARLNYVVC